MKPAMFSPGRLVATPAVLDTIMCAKQHSLEFVCRHVNGDWGDVCPADAAANARAVRDGDRILSVYKTRQDVTIWVITEGDRSATTLLLPEEY